ncbi:hypothetical protein [Acidithiobacillus sp.]
MVSLTAQGDLVQPAMGIGGRDCIVYRVDDFRWRMLWRLAGGGLGPEHEVGCERISSSA